MKKLAPMMLGLTAALPLHAQDASTGTPPPDSSSNATPPADNSSQLPASNASGGAPAPSAQTAPPSDNNAAASTPPPSDNNAAASSPPPSDNSAAATPAPAPAESSSSNAAPASNEAAPATTESSAPATTTEAAPASTEAAPATTEAAPASTEAAPATTESTPPAESTVAAPEVASTPASGGEKKPWIFYVGADYGSVKVSISDSNLQAKGFPTGDFANRIWQARFGMRLTDAIGAEVHFAKGREDDNTPNQPMMDANYGVYVVPTGTLLDLVEFGFPLGFAWTRIKGGGASTTEDGVSYGANMEFPFKLVWDSLPDIRIGGGGMVYQQNNSSRTYGWHAGLRWDFAVGGGPEPAPAPAPAPEAPAPAPEAAPPPPPPPCQAPAEGQAANLEGCKGGESLVLKGVNFEFNKATLTTNAKTLLDQVADELNKHPDIKFEIDGYTDSKGSDPYNQKLSEKRAKSVAAYLASKGIDKKRMTTKGFGESNPIADNNTDEGREQNRRVELKVLEAGGGAAPAAGTEAQPAAAAPAAESQPAPAPTESTPAPATTESAPAPATTESQPAAESQPAPASQSAPASETAPAPAPETAPGQTPETAPGSAPETAPGSTQSAPAENSSQLPASNASGGAPSEQQQTPQQ